MQESRIFKNEEALLPEYLPELLPHRENQIKQLANNMLPASKGRKPQNTFIFGPPGIGKTASVKFVFREFEEYAEVRTIYINCWDYRTAIAILSKIVIEFGSFAQRRGVSRDEALERTVEVLNKKKIGVVICLDEVDQLILNDEQALYDLLRIDQYVKIPFGIVFVSNDPHVFSKVDSRIKSSLAIENIEFKPYSFEEMKNILKERAELAVHVIEEGVVALCANHAIQNGGDVRIGLECLIKSARLAENENSDKIKVSHIQKILNVVKPVKPQILKKRLNFDEEAILKIVEEKRRIFSGELYQEYSKSVEMPVSDRRFRDFLNHLAKLNLVRIEERKRGIKGKKRTVIKV